MGIAEREQETRSEVGVSEAALEAERALPGRKLACSVDVGWNSLLVRAFASTGDIPTFETMETPEQLLTVGIGGQCHYESFIGGQWRSASFRSGTGSMAPPGVTKRSRWKTEDGQFFQTAHLWIPQQNFLDIEEEYRRIGTRGRAESLNAFVFNDAVVTQVVFSLVKSMKLGASNLYADTAAQFLATHLLTMQSALLNPRTERRRPKILTDGRIIHVLQYMRENLSKPLSLDQLASEAGVSRFHFVKLFRERLGTTPHRHLVQLRMHHGAMLLKRTDMSVSELAAASGYVTTAHFSAAFHKHYGQAALRYRQLARDGLATDHCNDERLRSSKNIRCSLECLRVRHA